MAEEQEKKEKLSEALKECERERIASVEQKNVEI